MKLIIMRGGGYYHSRFRLCPRRLYHLTPLKDFLGIRQFQFLNLFPRGFKLSAPIRVEQE